mmetsp:Transcript_4328/g.12111  ORF Transcript_4328/g.12111 Transcript_4328/m.12111 type:complete len:129 (+) Transcript_4328:1459-1845(+)
MQEKQLEADKERLDAERARAEAAAKEKAAAEKWERERAQAEAREQQRQLEEQQKMTAAKLRAEQEAEMAKFEEKSPKAAVSGFAADLNAVGGGGEAALAAFGLKPKMVTEDGSSEDEGDQVGMEDGEL